MLTLMASLTKDLRGQEPNLAWFIIITACEFDLSFKKLNTRKYAKIELDSVHFPFLRNKVDYK